jgi:hypothetical protein
MTNNPSCPFCGSKNTCSIFYGYPADIEWYLESSAKGEIVGGGCCVSSGDPIWHCHNCSNEWGKNDDF